MVEVYPHTDTTKEDATETDSFKTKLKLKIDRYKDGSNEHKLSRHDDWRETYQLYRDKVIINRLTQRQSVNVPLVKETVKTILASIDDNPDIRYNMVEDTTGIDAENYYEEADSNRIKELVLNEYWKDFYEKVSLSIKDIVDKKNVLLYGRSFKKIFIANGRMKTEIVDPADIGLDRYCDTTDIDSANYLGHYHIYRTIGELKTRKHYDKSMIEELEKYYATSQGLIQAEENVQNYAKKIQKNEDLGDYTALHPQLGETYVEINEHYIKIYDEDLVKQYDCESDGYVLYYIVTCENKILFCDAFKEVMKVNFFPYETWADDIEGTSFWSDGIGDMVRTPNKVLNAWFSQLVENRTLRNFGMNYYNSTEAENWSPQTFTPIPGGWYPLPFNPNEQLKRIDIPDLSESLDEMNFIIEMVQRASAATATLKGETAGSRTTLGEIELVTKQAMERITSLAKFYREGWKRYAKKWVDIVMANVDDLDDVILRKKGKSGKIYEQKITPAMFKAPTGYEVSVMSSAEQEKNNLDTINKFQAVSAQMPNNVPLALAKKRKLLTLLNLTPEEEQNIMDFEEQNPTPMMPPEGSPTSQLPAGQPAMAQ